MARTASYLLSKQDTQDTTLLNTQLAVIINAMNNTEPVETSTQKELEHILSLQPPRNEEEAKFQIIAPLLLSLGWQIRDGNQVAFEHAVGNGRQSGKVDFALKANGRVVAMIEAKAPNTNLKQHVTQVLHYAFHEGIDICALTTGLQWWLYLPREPGPPERRRFAVLTIRKDETLNEVAKSFVKFLARSNLVSGEAIVSAKHHYSRTRLEHLLPQVWEKMLAEPDDDILSLVSSKVAKASGGATPDRSQIVALLQNQFRQSSSREETSHKPQRRAKSTVPVMVLFGQRHQIANNASGVLKVAEILQSQNPDRFSQLVTQCRFIVLERHPKRPITTKPVNNSGYFLDTNFNAENLWTHARQMMRLSGYSDNDLELIYER